MDWSAFLAQHIPAPATITVEAYAGSGATGDVYDPPATVTGCVIDDTARTVRVQSYDMSGREAVSSTTVFAPPGTTVPPASRVTLPDGRTSRVLAVSRLEAHGLDLPEHTEIHLE